MSDTSIHIGSGLPTSQQPKMDAEVEPYWEAARNGTLVVPFCPDCNDYFWYPRGFCPRCSSSAIEWRESTGTGTLYSYSVPRKSFGVWKEHAPFIVAWVTLDEGITLATNLMDVDLDKVEIGMPVRGLFERHEPEDAPMLRFVPAS
jgi:uncharacterized OB-fold protein